MLQGAIFGEKKKRSMFKIVAPQAAVVLVALILSNSWWGRGHRQPFSRGTA